MKFISGIKKENSDNGVDIKIPIYHRTSISFFNGSEVYFIHRTYQSQNYTIGELILSPLNPSIWHHIRKLTIAAIDSPGIIYTITSKLRDLKINVNVQEAITTQIGAIHSMSLIIDISVFLHNHPKRYNVGEKVPDEAIEEIETNLKKLVYPNTTKNIIEDGNISIKELTMLESISNIPSNFNLSNIYDIQFKNCTNQKIKNTNGKIHLDPKILNSLNIRQSSFYYTMLSDTEEKYIKLLFFDTNQTVAFIDILHEDVYGAIAEFTKIIHENYSYNLLASYSHQQMQKETAHWYALIDLGNRSREFFTETLDALRTAKYGEHGDKKNVLEVFLLETNTDNIPPDTIRKYGQNKLTMDGDRTAIYTKKIDLIKKCLDEYSVKSYLKSPKQFVEHYQLHKTKSVHRLINNLIKQEVRRKSNIKNSILRKTIAFLLPVILLWVLALMFNPIEHLLEELFKHSVGLALIAVTIALIVFVDKIMKKILE